MSMTHQQQLLKSENLSALLNQLQQYIHNSAQNGTAIHEVERTIWQEVLRIGRHCVGFNKGRMRIFKVAMKWLLGLLFMAAGVYHFVNPSFYVRIMPPYLPWHLELVYLSGAFELVLGGLLLVPKCTRYAAWGLIALLLAVFPANIHMAINDDLYADIPPLVLWLRLPLQGVFIAWAYWFTRRES